MTQSHYFMYVFIFDLRLRRQLRSLCVVQELTQSVFNLEFGFSSVFICSRLG